MSLSRNVKKNFQISSCLQGSNRSAANVTFPRATPPPPTPPPNITIMILHIISYNYNDNNIYFKSPNSILLPPWTKG